jgi:hypothetical protein
MVCAELPLQGALELRKFVAELVHCQIGQERRVGRSANERFQDSPRDAAGHFACL